MGTLRDKLLSFMYGRYGVDQLYYALFAIFIILAAVNMFIHSVIIYVLIWALIIWSIYRSFSKNIYKRQMENEKFLMVWNKVKEKYKLTIRRCKEIKTHRYRKCPNCKKTLRLPKRLGKHTVNCPCCHRDFELRILF